MTVGPSILAMIITSLAHFHFPMTEQDVTDDITAWQIHPIFW